jgi:hypothetical protein
MRPLMPADLDCAVAVVLGQPPQDRRWAADQLLAQADVADRYRKRFGRAHSAFGSGSVMSAARRWPLGPVHPICDPAYCDGLSIVLDAVRAWRHRLG